MLLQVRDYIQKHGQVSSQQICRHFIIDYSALEPILHRWQSLGVIKAHQSQSACSKKCSQSCSEPLVYYQFCR
ncbi:FeoC-like transcriptional regulator [Legionella sp. W05-934-2]|jgi:hypothetical protein|uniref:FeoC-like transcriptional regulator n=1 Tax=Legionella sp. W05-934-2 TaxID=1198649 RepID=UPI003462FB8D